MNLASVNFRRVFRTHWVRRDGCASLIDKKVCSARRSHAIAIHEEWPRVDIPNGAQLRFESRRWAQPIARGRWP